MAHRYRGKSLKDVRECQNLKLRRISEETRITTWYLAGIEEEQLRQISEEVLLQEFRQAIRAEARARRFQSRARSPNCLRRVGRRAQSSPHTQRRFDLRR